MTDDTHTTEQLNGLDVSTDSGATVTANRPPDVTPPPDPVGMLGVPGAIGTQGRSYISTRGHLFLTNSRTVSTLGCSADRSGGANNPGRPIQVNTGTKYETYPLFQLPGEMGLSYTLYYNTSVVGAWFSNLDYRLDLYCSTQDQGICKQVTYYKPDGSTLIFSGNPGVGPFTEQGGGGLATLTYNASTAMYTLHDEDGTTKTFSAADSQIKSIVDASGVGWTIGYTTANSITTYTVTHTSGQSYSVTETGSQTSVTDPAGNVYVIVPGTTSSSITLPGIPATVIGFKYDPTVHRLSEVDYNGVPYDYTTYITNTADPHYAWANANYKADNTEGVYLSYSTDSAGNVEAQITNSLGHQTTQTYDGTNGSGGAYNGLLTLISDTAVTTCGATTHGRSYDANGNLSETIDNNGNIHTYTYALNGQLQTETEAYGTPIARTTNYVWDPNQQLNRLLSKTVVGWAETSYTYNAQNRLASVSITNLTGNGASNQTLTTNYSYALYSNGMVQTMTVAHPSPNGSDTDTYTYDVLGNLTSQSNGLGQTTTYSNYTALGLVGHVVGPNGDAIDYTYDARGRLATKTTHPSGTAATWTYTYDGFGLLYIQTGPDGQVTTWNRDPSSMRVTSITHNDKDGTSTESFGYDANGDVIQHSITRSGTVGLAETYHYDALGRVYQKIGQNGQSLTYAYDGNGNVLSTADAVGHTISYQYDALNRVTQKTESGGASPAMPTTAPTLNVPSTSSTGGYTVSWNSITGATYYLLQEQVNSGSWMTVQNSASISWSPTNKVNNAYGYRVGACNATGCGPWSNVGTITVSVPTAPASAPSLTVPGTSANGNYTVSWTSVPNTSSYTLQEQVNGGSWTTIQSGASISWSVTGKTNGTYAYRSQACNGVGCGPWSNTGTMVVTWPPVPAVPTGLSAPSYTTSNNYTVTWNSTANATTYVLNAAPYGSSWSTVSNSASTSWAASGQSNFVYVYEVQACNISGCSAFSSAIATWVTVPAPIAINGQTYTGVYTVSTGSAAEAIGFDITGGATWEVYHTISGNTHVNLATGAIPFGAVTVQYTWTDAGVPTTFTDAGGSVTTNQASAPVAVSGNPSTLYVSNAFTKVGNHGHQYYLKVDFFNGGGQNISSSTCLLIGEVTGNQ